MPEVYVGWLHQLPAEAWKNGGGTTRTLAQGGGHVAGVPGWRVSLADIVQDGAYSPFPGQTRHSLIVTGAGVDLADGSTRVALRPHQPLVYDGAPAWQATLVDGPVRALNVMVDTRRFAASLDLITDEHVAAPAVVRLALAFNIQARLGPADGARPARLHAGEYLVDTRADMAFTLAPTANETPAGTLALIRIWPLADAGGLASPRNPHP